MLIGGSTVALAVVAFGVVFLLPLLAGAGSGRTGKAIAQVFVFLIFTCLVYLLASWGVFCAAAALETAKQVPKAVVTVHAAAFAWCTAPFLFLAWSENRKHRRLPVRLRFIEALLRLWGEQSAVGGFVITGGLLRDADATVTTLAYAAAAWLGFIGQYVFPDSSGLFFGWASWIASWAAAIR